MMKALVALNALAILMSAHISSAEEYVAQPLPRAVKFVNYALNLNEVKKVKISLQKTVPNDCNSRMLLGKFSVVVNKLGDKILADFSELHSLVGCQVDPAAPTKLIQTDSFEVPVTCNKNGCYTIINVLVPEDLQLKVSTTPQSK